MALFSFLAPYIKAGNYIIKSSPFIWKRGFTQRQIQFWIMERVVPTNDPFKKGLIFKVWKSWFFQGYYYYVGDGLFYLKMSKTIWKPTSCWTTWRRRNTWWKEYKNWLVLLPFFGLHCIIHLLICRKSLILFNIVISFPAQFFFMRIQRDNIQKHSLIIAKCYNCVNWLC